MSQIGSVESDRMKRILVIIAVIFAIGSFAAQAAPRPTIIFEATVVRLDSWGLMKFSCGVAVNFRLATYKVDAVSRGHIAPGEQIIVQHLACNWNELDDPKVGDKVIVVAEVLKHPETHFWTPNLDGSALAQATDGVVNIPLKHEPVLIRYSAVRVAKIAFPTNP
jgi:hypothetical protein